MLVPVLLFLGDSLMVTARLVSDVVLVPVLVVMVTLMRGGEVGLIEVGAVRSEDLRFVSQRKRRKRTL